MPQIDTSMTNEYIKKQFTKDQVMGYYTSLINELEYKLCCVLDIATNSRINKPCTNMSDIKRAIQDNHLFLMEEAIKGYTTNTIADIAGREAAEDSMQQERLN